MDRRELIKSAAGLTARGSMGLVRPAFAATPTMKTVCKIVGVPYFSLLEQGLGAAASANSRAPWPSTTPRTVSGSMRSATSRPRTSWSTADGWNTPG